MATVDSRTSPPVESQEIHTTTPQERAGPDQPRQADTLGSLGELIGLPRSLAPRPKKNIQALIVDFAVETDSVVATATIRTDGVVRRIVVDWGDGETDILNTVPGRHVAVFPPRDPLPPGTYRLYHAYAEPEDRKPFTSFVLVRVDDANGPDFRTLRITLTPRYRVTNYRTTVWLESPCDSIFESSNEFDITQLVDGVPVNQWRWEPSNNFFPLPFRLEDSQISRELTLADPGVNVSLELFERDPIQDEFVRIFQNLSAAQESDRNQRTKSDGGCKVTAQWDREVQLIVPLPPGPTLEATEVAPA